MKILILGNGAREHAIAWHLRKSRLNEIFVANGNAGTGKIATNLDTDLLNHNDIIKAAKRLDADIVVVGPEKLLAEGIVNELAECGIKAFGPTREAAQIESSKSFAMKLMDEEGIAHPWSIIARSQEEALSRLKRMSYPVVIKADGLMGGKGVWICEDKYKAKKTIREYFAGRSKEPIILQRHIEGKEVSVFAFSDGNSISSLVAACDYKKLLDRNEGPNTGGMGSYAWPDSSLWNDKLEESVREIILTVIGGMRERGYPFVGIIYAGLIVDEHGCDWPLEFNCRFGDPEAQVILPLLKTDLAKIMMACVEGRLDKVPVAWRKDRTCVAVNMVTGNYPDSGGYGHEIEGLGRGNIRGSKELVFQGGTKEDVGGKVVVNGGRVVTVVGVDDERLIGAKTSREVARIRAYNRLESIRFQDEFHRNDIAQA